MATPSKVVVDDLGDVTMIVGPERREFVVCSRALARASPVFKRMLYDKLQSRNEPWIVSLPEDNDIGAEILFNASHCRFDSVPTNVPVSSLFVILEFADKYDMAKSLQPWAKLWTPSRDTVMKGDPCFVISDLAWRTGDRHMFEHTVKEFCLGASPDVNGKLIFYDGVRPSELPSFYPADLTGEFNVSTDSHEQIVINVVNSVREAQAMQSGPPSEDIRTYQTCYPYAANSSQNRRFWILQARQAARLVSCDFVGLPRSSHGLVSKSHKLTRLSGGRQLHFQYQDIVGEFTELQSSLSRCQAQRLQSSIRVTTRSRRYCGGTKAPCYRRANRSSLETEERARTGG